MEKEALIKLLNELFNPLDFKRKGNNWIYNGEIITKIVELQKSNYSNSYYINYGYIIKGIELTTSMHIYKGLGSINENENKKIADLLNLENSIPITERLAELQEFIQKIIVKDFHDTNTEDDILEELKNRPDLNNIPLVVKEYFNLEQTQNK
jgi:hypothetical protein